MSGYAASSPYTQAAYVPPLGQAAVQVGTATYHFLNIPVSMKMIQFIGLAFVIFVLARHWGRFVNEIA